MASALGSTVAAASIGSRRGFSLGRGQNLQRVMGGEVALVPLPGGAATIKEDSARTPRNVHGDANRA
jgi:hypothetical protein